MGQEVDFFRLGAKKTAKKGQQQQKTGKQIEQFPKIVKIGISWDIFKYSKLNIKSMIFVMITMTPWGYPQDRILVPRPGDNE